MGYATKGKAWKQAKRDAMRTLQQILDARGYDDTDTLPLWGLGQRTKIFDRDEELFTGKKKPARGILMPDAHEHIIGAPFAKELLHLIQKTPDCPIALGHVWQDNGAVKLVKAFDRCKLFIMTDGENWDGSVPRWATQFAFDVIQQAFIPSEIFDIEGHLVEDETRLSEARALKRIFRWIEAGFSRPTVVLESGEIYRLPGGVASGSIWTTIVNSIVNYALWAYVIRKTGHDENLFCMRVYGDDSVVGYRGTTYLNVARMWDHWTKISGIKVSKEKSTTSDCVEMCGDVYFGVHFLGKYIDVGGRNPIRPVADTYRQLLLPERLPRSDEEEVTRVYGVICDNPFNTDADEVVRAYLRWLAEEGKDRDKRSTAGITQGEYAGCVLRWVERGGALSIYRDYEYVLRYHGDQVLQRGMRMREWTEDGYRLRRVQAADVCNLIS
jgi:hypothetical protein